MILTIEYLSKPITVRSGAIAVLRDGEAQIEITPKLLLTNALTSEFAGDKAEGFQKYRRYRLAEKIEEATEDLEITDEQLEYIKEVLPHSGMHIQVWGKVARELNLEY